MQPDNVGRRCIRTSNNALYAPRMRYACGYVLQDRCVAIADELNFQMARRSDIKTARHVVEFVRSVRRDDEGVSSRRNQVVKEVQKLVDCGHDKTLACEMLRGTISHVGLYIKRKFYVACEAAVSTLYI